MSNSASWARDGGAVHHAMAASASARTCAGVARPAKPVGGLGGRVAAFDVMAGQGFLIEGSGPNPSTVRRAAKGYVAGSALTTYVFLLRSPSVLSRSALSLMKPWASFWS